MAVQVEQELIKNSNGKLTIADNNGIEGSLYVSGYADDNAITCTGGTVEISGGDVYIHGQAWGDLYYEDGDSGRGIKLSDNSKLIISGGDIYVYSDEIPIEGGTVEITGGNVEVFSAGSTSIVVNKIKITGGNVYAYDDSGLIEAEKSITITGGYITLNNDMGESLTSKGIKIAGDTVINCKTLLNSNNKYYDYISSANIGNLSQNGCIAYYLVKNWGDNNDSYWKANYDSLPYKIVYKDKNGKTVTAKSGISKLEAVEPTCTKAGHTAGYKVKSRSFYSTIPATGHTAVIDEAVAPTCESTGLTEGSHCSVCGETIVAQKVIKALGHDYESEVTTEPTYTTTGVRTYTCKNDSSHTYTEVIPTLSHTIVTDEAVEPTCESMGLTEGSHCSDCGEIFVKQEEIPMLGHDYEGTVTTEPTCTEAGVKTYTCKNDASHTYTEEIPALGHTVVTDEAVAPTCESTGLTEGSHCSVCGEVIVAQETVEALGHAYDDGVVTAEATCTESGVKTFTCANDASHTYTEKIPALGHSVVTDEAVDATCENSGLTEGTHCSVCGEVLTAQETVEALGHKWSKWTVSKEATSTENGEKVKTCSVCGQQQTKVIPATAIVPEDTTVVNNATTNTTVNAKAYDGSTPKTGDNSNIALWVSAFALSLAGVLAVVRKKSRRVK